MDVRKTYPTAAAAGKFTIFNIGGGKYRLVIAINYQSGKVFIQDVLTHTDYSKKNWSKP